MIEKKLGVHEGFNLGSCQEWLFSPTLCFSFHSAASGVREILAFINKYYMVASSLEQPCMISCFYMPPKFFTLTNSSKFFEIRVMDWEKTPDGECVLRLIQQVQLQMTYMLGTTSNQPTDSNAIKILQSQQVYGHIYYY